MVDQTLALEFAIRYADARCAIRRQKRILLPCQYIKVQPLSIAYKEQIFLFIPDSRTSVRADAFFVARHSAQCTVQALLNFGFL